MRRRLLQIVIVAGLALGAAPALADIVFSQLPRQIGGFVSDTDQTFFGQPHYWQRNAEDFLLDELWDIRQAVFWGYYSNALFGPDNETMRVRIYGARESDGLPDEGNIIYEQIVQNPHRQETGLAVSSLTLVPEYQYTIDLTSPVSIEAATTYWFEAVQVGDPDSDFFWESAHTATPQDRIASYNANHPDWFYQGPRVGLAFQLLTPEPHTLGIMLASLLLFPRRRGRREYRARSGCVFCGRCTDLECHIQGTHFESDLEISNISLASRSYRGIMGIGARANHRLHRGRPWARRFDS